MSSDRFSLWQFIRILHQCYRDLIPRCPFCNDTVIAKNARFSFISTSPLAAILYQIGKQHFREKTEPESVSSVNSIGRSRIMPKWIRLLVRGHVVRLLTNSNSKYGGLWSMHIVLVKYQRTHDSGKVVLSQRSFLVWLVGLFLCCIITVCFRCCKVIITYVWYFILWSIHSQKVVLIFFSFLTELFSLQLLVHGCCSECGNFRNDKYVVWNRWPLF